MEVHPRIDRRPVRVRWVAWAARPSVHPPRPSDVEAPTDRTRVMLDGKRGLAGQAHVRPVPILARREPGHLLCPFEDTHCNHEDILVRCEYKIGGSFRTFFDRDVRRFRSTSWPGDRTAQPAIDAAEVPRETPLEACECGGRSRSCGDGRRPPADVSFECQLSFILRKQICNFTVLTGRRSPHRRGRASETPPVRRHRTGPPRTPHIRFIAMPSN